MKYTDENTEGYSKSDLESLNEMWDIYRHDDRYSEWDDQNLSEKIMERYDSSQGWDLGDPL
ncbi:MAG: hypothetical protein PHC39_04665 [Proteiniphilum sp.]|nr:hypothetical protein [Proteiniphilum sp.]